MLTKNDAKIIKKIVENAVAPVQKDVSGLKQDVSGLRKDVSGLKSGQLRLEKGLKKEHKIGGEILDFLEKEDRAIKDRVDKIEFRLGIAPN